MWNSAITCHGSRETPFMGSFSNPPYRNTETSWCILNKVQIAIYITCSILDNNTLSYGVYSP